MSTVTPKRLSRWLRRGPWEATTIALIGLGLLMLMQPWSIEIYGYSFVVLLAGVAGYTVAVKLPQD
jgi:hypothetical protein